MALAINLGRIKPIDRGVWSATYNGGLGYGELDIVQLNGDTYQSKVASNTAEVTDATKWTCLAKVSDKASHGYGTEPQKTLKEVDDNLVQLAGDVGDKNEETLASVINAMKNEIAALKEHIANSEFSKIQAGAIDIQEDIKLKGSPLIYVGTTPPAIAPDQVPQFYVDITAKKLYTASGTANAGNWF